MIAPVRPDIEAHRDELSVRRKIAVTMTISTNDWGGENFIIKAHTVAAIKIPLSSFINIPGLGREEIA